LPREFYGALISSREIVVQSQRNFVDAKGLKNSDARINKMEKVKHFYAACFMLDIKTH